WTQQLSRNPGSPHSAIQRTKSGRKMVWIDESRLSLRVRIIVVPEHVVLRSLRPTHATAKQVVDDATYFLQLDRIAKIKKREKSVLFELAYGFRVEHGKLPGLILFFQRDATLLSTSSARRRSRACSRTRAGRGWNRVLLHCR